MYILPIFLCEKMLFKSLRKFFKEFSYKYCKYYDFIGLNYNYHCSSFNFLPISNLIIRLLIGIMLFFISGKSLKLLNWTFSFQIFLAASNLSYFWNWFGPHKVATHQQSPIRQISDMFWTFSPFRLPAVSNPSPTLTCFGPFHLSNCLQRTIHNQLQHSLDLATYQAPSKVQQVQCTIKQIQRHIRIN